VVPEQADTRDYRGVRRLSAYRDCGGWERFRAGATPPARASSIYFESGMRAFLLTNTARGRGGTQRHSRDTVRDVRGALGIVGLARALSTTGERPRLRRPRAGGGGACCVAVPALRRTQGSSPLYVAIRSGVSPSLLRAHAGCVCARNAHQSARRWRQRTTIRTVTLAVRCVGASRVRLRQLELEAVQAGHACRLRMAVPETAIRNKSREYRMPRFGHPRACYPRWLINQSG